MLPKNNVMPKKQKPKSSEKRKKVASFAYRLKPNKLGQYVVYDKLGKVVIITHHKRIAERYADDKR